ncbi:hypothetical protein [Streptomyces sp. IB2014 016-6]|uniref:hypothetical protein n=1 Tax=Streptomyces sp. IB2014 016-6 TaxID=2517818 RepID=UPI0016506C84|nr:hypothetical protein [Streptomyces sp. IB2014 016-6]
MAGHEVTTVSVRSAHSARFQGRAAAADLRVTIRAAMFDVALRQTPAVAAESA